MTFDTDSKYPIRRAYVVKVRGDATPDSLAGCLENLVTGRQFAFASGRELLETIASDIEATLQRCGRRQRLWNLTRPSPKGSR